MLLRARIDAVCKSRETWKTKAVRYMNFFTREELYTLYRLVFQRAVEGLGQVRSQPPALHCVSPLPHPPSPSPLSPPHPPGVPPRAALAGTHQRGRPKAFPFHDRGFTDADLFDRCLDEPFPRAPLNDLYTRLRTVLGMVEEVRRTPCPLSQPPSSPGGGSL